MRNYFWKSQFVLFVFGVFCNSNIVFGQPGDKNSFYQALASTDLMAINGEIDKLSSDNSTSATAYIGALMMKKAGLLKNPVNKLKDFKAGREKLEGAISSSPDNAEFKMLRFMTQEKAPSFLGYNKEIEADSQYLRDHFKSLDSTVQKVLIEYSKTSKFLKPSDFQP